MLPGCIKPRTTMMQVLSTDRRLRRDRTIEKFSIVTYGLVRHFSVCRGASGLLSIAYLKNVTSRHDPATGYGLHDDLRGMHVFLPYEGMHRYVETLSIFDWVPAWSENVVSTRFLRASLLLELKSHCQTLTNLIRI